LHKRNKNRIQERRARAFIFANAFMDAIRCETVSQVDRADVLAILEGPIDVDRIPQVEKGEVLVDTRGTGSFQVHA